MVQSSGALPPSSDLQNVEVEKCPLGASVSQCWLAAPHGVKIQQRLRRVLSGAVSCVHYRHRGHTRCVAC
eukprot:scaffold895_cov315-Pinguiococcus_pyrenoidosus.AAC.44